MKCEIVTKLNLKGEYELLYIGTDRGEARKIYKENMTKKDEFLALYQHSSPVSRVISKAGHTFRNEEKTKKQAPKPKRSKKAKSED